MTRDVLDIFYGTREIINFSMGVLVILFLHCENDGHVESM